MHTKILLDLQVKSLTDGEFLGLASGFGNIDAHGDMVQPGAFTKALAAGDTVPLLWEHQANDPRAYVGDIIDAQETKAGLQVRGRFDMESEFGPAAYRNVKGRRVTGLSIGYVIRKSVKNHDGTTSLTELDLIEVSLVARGANDRALVTAVKSAPKPILTLAHHRSNYARLIAASYSDTVALKGHPTMHTTRLERLTKDRDSQLAAVKTIIDTAEELGRDLTADEAATVQEATTDAKNLDKQIKQAIADQDTLAAAKALAAEIGTPGDSEPAPTGSLAMTGRHTKTLARTVIAALPKDRHGKALAAGQTTTSVQLLPEVAEQGRPAQSVLDALPARQVSTNYSFLRQTVRTNNAAPVAEGATKPTSVYTLVAVDAKLQVIAHVSEQIPHYVLSDNANLEQFVADEMLLGLRTGIENQLVNGNGTSPNLPGILTTSGIQSQAFTTDVLTSTRKAITKLETIGHSADLLMVSATDWEALELLAATAGAVDHRGIPLDAAQRRLWGVQVVVSTVLPAKTAILLDKNAVTLDTDANIDTRWSDAVGTDFTSNHVRCRVEGRFGVSVFQPAAIVRIDTAA